MTLEQYCKNHGKNSILKEWVKSKNEGCLPETVSYASHHLVWWQCEKGHVWKCAVKERTGRNTGCPYCSGRRPISGETDLASEYPELAMEWHPKRNGDRKPEEVRAGSEQKVWWQCSLGHEWQASIENRALKGNKCPYCTGRKAWPGFNDFATLYPDLLAEWHPKLNGSLDPSKIRPGAKKRVYWMCSEGHVWDTWIFSRTSKKRPGCPFCAGRVRMENNWHNKHINKEHINIEETGVSGQASERLNIDNSRVSGQLGSSLISSYAGTTEQESGYRP